MAKLIDSDLRRRVRMLWANRTSALDCADISGAAIATVRRLFDQWEGEVDGLSPHSKEIEYLRASIRCRREWNLWHQWKLEKMVAVEQNGPAPKAELIVRLSDTIYSCNKESQTDDRLLLDCARQQQPAAEAPGGVRPAANVTVNGGSDRGDPPASRPSEVDD